MYLVPRLLVNVRERLVRFHQFQTTIDYIFGVTAIALAVYNRVQALRQIGWQPVPKQSFISVKGRYIKIIHRCERQKHYGGWTSAFRLFISEGNSLRLLPEFTAGLMALTVQSFHELSAQASVLKRIMYGASRTHRAAEVYSLSFLDGTRIRQTLEMLAMAFSGRLQFDKFLR
jgi:hypothetical protein